MTAPAIPTGEVVAPVTESATPTPAPAAEESAFDLDAFASNLAKELTPGSNMQKQDGETDDAAVVAKAVDEAVQAVVDERGRAHDPATGQFLPKSETPEAAPAAAEGPAEPVVEAAPETPVPEPEKPKAPFTVYGADGQPIDPATLPAFQVETNINGKPFKGTLDQVVRRAQSAGYNAKLEEEVAQAREFVPKATERLTQLEAAVREREEYVYKLLNDPNVYIEQQEQFQKAFTPEAQLERERAARQELEQREKQRESVSRLAQATETVILPRFQALLQKYPHVTAEELHKTFAPLVRPLQANGGPIPVEAIPQVVEIIDTVLAGYAENLHEARAEAAKAKADTDAREKAANDAAERAKVEAQQKAQKELATAKAELSRTIAPVGSTAAPGQQKPKNMTRDQSAQWALEDALSSVGYGKK